MWGRSRLCVFYLHLASLFLFCPERNSHSSHVRPLTLADYGDAKFKVNPKSCAKYIHDNSVFWPTYTHFCVTERREFLCVSSFFIWINCVCSPDNSLPVGHTCFFSIGRTLQLFLMKLQKLNSQIYCRIYVGVYDRLSIDSNWSIARYRLASVHFSGTRFQQNYVRLPVSAFVLIFNSCKCNVQ